MAKSLTDKLLMIERYQQMDSLIPKIEEWSAARKLDTQDSAKQLLKLIEEVGELSAAYNKKQVVQEIDSVGDILVVLTIYCQQRGLSIRDCLELAYEQISGRKGKLVNGVFVKEVDLNE
ncbi:MazG-like family protein [Levilactobacillus angrenensis]|uniref:MazG-like family protein n=1 Tax=Levilactobacillus angrenensis TaxID=2486020 RepID=A0ABW1UDH4_9LACO|nr:MazG-like family protein [Levilactobacillus angrenensis]